MFVYTRLNGHISHFNYSINHIESNKPNKSKPSISSKWNTKAKNQTHQKHAPEQASNHKKKKEEMEEKTESGKEITSKRKKTIGNDWWAPAQKFSKLIFLQSWLKNVKKRNRKTMVTQWNE